MTGNGLLAGLTLAGIKIERLASFSRVPTSTIKGMLATGNKPVRATRRTVRNVVQALKVKGGVEITDDGVRLVRKPHR